MTGFTLTTCSCYSLLWYLRHFSSYQVKPLTFVSDLLFPDSRTMFFLTMMLQTVFTAFCRFLCQCKSLLLAGRIPYSVLKTCREILTSMPKIGVTCLLTLGQLEFIQKWIRNTNEKKKEAWGREISPNCVLFPVAGNKTHPFVAAPDAVEISDTHFHLFSSV